MIENRLHDVPALLPRPMPDETIQSYITRAHRVSCFFYRMTAQQYLYGGLSNSSVHPTIGHPNLDRAIARQWPDINFDSLTDSSYLPLFEPFTETSAFNLILERRRERPMRKHSIGVASNASTLLRKSPAFCLECTEDDIKLYGHSFWRRSHQVLAVEYCAAHKTRLIDGCSHCGTLSQAGLPNSSCEECGGSMQDPSSKLKEDPYKDAKIAVAKIIDSIFRRELAIVSTERRLAAYASRLAERLADVDHECTLKSFLCRMFGTEYFERLGFSIWRTFADSHSRLFSHDEIFNNPIANVILIAALFDSPDKYPVV